MSKQSEFVTDSGSFRDPSSRVLTKNKTIIRGLSQEATTQWGELKKKDFFKKYSALRKIIATTEYSGAIPHSDNSWTMFLEHERIPFISYPYEWCFSMLKDAACLQLELLQAALAEGMILKDSTPYNIQWFGGKPVFIDIPSFVQHRSGDPWQAYGQFCQLFLFPLMLGAFRGLDFQPLMRAHIDGISPRDMWSCMSIFDLFRSGVLSHVYLHAKLQTKKQGASEVRSEMRQAGFSTELIKHNVKSLLKLVTSLKQKDKSSVWSSYEERCPYIAQARSSKEQVVSRILEQKRRSLVWDLGSNTGFFSRLAARHSEYVLALDSDPECIERLYCSVRDEGLSNILPLVWDISNPSPGLGFKNVERKTLLERGKPDCALALALIHHLAISGSIPLSDIMKWFSEITSELVIEWVGPEDPMVRELLGQKNIPYEEYTLANFESATGKFFRTVERCPLPESHRILFLLEKP